MNPLESHHPNVDHDDAWNYLLRNMDAKILAHVLVSVIVYKTFGRAHLVTERLNDITKCWVH